MKVLSLHIVEYEFDVFKDILTQFFFGFLHNEMRSIVL
jgi:hypothetical protein